MAVFFAHLGEWWARLLAFARNDRPSDRPAPAPARPKLPVSASALAAIRSAGTASPIPPAAIATPAATPVPATPALPAPARLDETEGRGSLLETLQLSALPAPAVRATAAVDPAVRARTLTALEGLRQIPALQSLAKGFVRVTSQADASLDEIVASIEKDPALCIRVLQLANSAMISPAQRIDEVSAAVHMLGVVRVRTLALTLFTLRGSRSVAEGFDWRHLWIHSFAVAAVSAELETLLDLPPSPNLYLAALLHDVGKIVLSTIAPEDYRDVLIATWNSEAHLAELELARLGVDHAEAGLTFATQSQLPAAVLETTAHHGHPAQATSHRTEVALVSIANYICKAWGLGFSGARLGPDDGEFEDLEAWQVLATEHGMTPNPAALAEPIKAFIIALKPELGVLREGI